VSDGEQSNSRAAQASAILAAVVAVAGGLYVASNTVGFYGAVNHCPDAEIACPSIDLRNLLPALVGTPVAVAIILPYKLIHDRVFKNVE